MTSSALIGEAERAAIVVGVPAKVFLALIEIESEWNPYAWNPEPRYRWFWNVKTDMPFRPVSAVEVASKFPPFDFLSLAGDRDQEWWGQQASWGLCQVMGAVAREHRIRIKYLPQLCEPLVNMSVGAAHLGKYVSKYGLNNGLAAYNAGPGGRTSATGLAYAKKVLDRSMTL